MKGKPFTVTVSGLSYFGTVTLLLPSGFSSSEGLTKSFSSGTSTVSWTTIVANQKLSAQTISATITVPGSPSTATSNSFDVLLLPTTITTTSSGICLTPCPSPSEWIACGSDSFQQRTNYKCDSTTNYSCQLYVESRRCTPTSCVSSHFQVGEGTNIIFGNYTIGLGALVAQGTKQVIEIHEYNGISLSADIFDYGTTKNYSQFGLSINLGKMGCGYYSCYGDLTVCPITAQATTTTLFSNETTSTTVPNEHPIPTCKSQGAVVCKVNETCPDKWLKANETDRCCSVICVPADKDKGKPTTTTIPSSTVPLCNGCSLDNTCVPFGTRTLTDGKPVYCDIDNNFDKQKPDNETCQNNYECASNSCSNGVCINIQAQLEAQKSILQKIYDFLKSIFSFFGNLFGRGTPNQGQK